MKIIFDVTKPHGKRVQSVHVKCRDCDIPEFVPIEDDKSYRIVINSYIAGGGDGYSLVRDNFENRERGKFIGFSSLRSHAQRS